MASRRAPEHLWTKVFWTNATIPLAPKPILTGVRPSVGSRSKSFPGQAITTGRTIASPRVLNDLRDGTLLALRKADEVARNGVLQRITSARGFL